MNFLIYDKRGNVVNAINVEPKVTARELQKILDRYNQDMNKYHGKSSDDFNITIFMKWLYSIHNIRSCEINFDRLNLREVTDARLD